MKHVLEIRYYLRYADDFVIVHHDRKILASIIEQVQESLHETLKISLHPDKISIRKIRQGIDFLGYIIMPHYKIIRTRTKKRMIKRLKQKRSALLREKITSKQYRQCIESYKGMLKHANSYKTLEKIQNLTGATSSHSFTHTQNHATIARLYKSPNHVVLGNVARTKIRGLSESASDRAHDGAARVSLTDQ